MASLDSGTTDYRNDKGIDSYRTLVLPVSIVKANAKYCIRKPDVRKSQEYDSKRPWFYGIL